LLNRCCVSCRHLCTSLQIQSSDFDLDLYH
jgi:hypothetical protein